MAFNNRLVFILQFNNQVERGAIYNIELYDPDLRKMAVGKDNGRTLAVSRASSTKRIISV